MRGHVRTAYFPHCGHWKVAKRMSNPCVPQRKEGKRERERKTETATEPLVRGLSYNYSLLLGRLAVQQQCRPNGLIDRQEVAARPVLVAI